MEHDCDINDDVVIGQDSFVTHSRLGYHVQINRRNIIDGASIKYRFSDEQIDELLRIKWCDWPADRLKENISLFKNQVDNVTISKLLEISGEGGRPSENFKVNYECGG